MSDARFECSVCGTVFSDHQAALNPADPDGGMACPSCGSVQFEPYEFDPDGPPADPLEEPEDEGSGA